ncbi:hypothetical protein C0992_007245, partial [Termitomyces sp. T32_za158]
ALRSDEALLALLRANAPHALLYALAHFTKDKPSVLLFSFLQGLRNHLKTNNYALLLLSTLSCYVVPTVDKLNTATEEEEESMLKIWDWQVAVPRQSWL